MALNIFQTYKYHELIDKEYSLYKVSNDGVNFGITNRNSYLEMFDSEVNPFRVPKEILQRLSIRVLPVSLVFCHYDEEREIAKDTEFGDNEYNPSIDDSLDAFDGDVDAYNEWRL